jgi:hypothetical protein
MNFADLSTVEEPASSPSPASAPLPTLAEVVARIAAEVSVPLTAALDRVINLSSSGRIDRPGLRALCAEIDVARRVGMRGQQIARFARGQVQQSAERLDLAKLLGEVLAERSDKVSPGALGSRQSLSAAEVMGDPSMVVTLLRAVADWSEQLACAGVEWRLDVKPWPVRARLSARFAHRPADLALPADPASHAIHLEHLDTLDWLLVQYTAHIAGVSVQRADDASHTQLTLEFQHTVSETLESAIAADLSCSNGVPPVIAGSQLLVLAAKRDLRKLVREAMQGHDLFIDHVPSVAEAQEYCEDSVPQAFIYESSFDSEALRALCARLGRLKPGVALIEIEPAGRSCSMGGLGGGSAAHIGADGLRQLLPSVLVLELARRR